MGQRGRQNSKPPTVWQQLLTCIAISFIVVVFGIAATHSVQVIAREFRK